MGYLLGFYIPEWTALTITAFIVGSLFTSTAFLGASEATPYSKFGDRLITNTIPSRRAMLIIYVPSVIVCLAFQLPNFSIWEGASQFDIIHTLTLLHFSKRVFEVLFVHIYRSKTDLQTALTIMFTYTTTTLLDLLVVSRIPNDVFSPDLTKVGIVMVLVGMIVNGYHHYLLRRMRTSKDKQFDSYSLPKGGLFNLVVAPHYAAEQFTFLGFILVSQNIVSLILKSFPFVYLTFRALKTREWYQANLTDKNDKLKLDKIKNLIPFVW
ncbi:3-oxo-5-alpha-steroid 4-dehydrogenase-domain-containing protein [Pilobolus umbonatus]|nr:3-oxo-5-alpha-steroid 4-dehydrogenase-domain-containing protein [Pilobolus umbonatus]